jgi:hypothetical protein
MIDRDKVKENIRKDFFDFFSLGEIQSILSLVDHNYDLLSKIYGDFWDDLRFPVTQTKQGSNLKPDFDETEIGLLFPQNDTTEKIYIISQMPHEWKLESELRPHIHFIQDEAEVPTFKMDYRWYKNGETPPETFTTIETHNEVVFNYEGQPLLQILSFPPIDGTGIDRVSSVMDIIIYRDDNVVAGDVLVKEFDIHHLVNAPGSVEEFSKY